MMPFSKVLSCMQLRIYLNERGCSHTASIHYLKTRLPMGHTNSVHDTQSKSMGQRQERITRQQKCQSPLSTSMRLPCFWVPNTPSQTCKKRSYVLHVYILLEPTSAPLLFCLLILRFLASTHDSIQWVPLQLRIGIAYNMHMEGHLTL